MNYGLALYYLSRELDDKPGEKAAEEKGRRGEMKVTRALKCMQHLYGGHYYSDVQVTLPSGGSAQIDHIYICKLGFFVIETKNYSGYVAGGQQYERWVQVLSTGHYYFHSPYLQNQGHIRCLLEAIGDAPMENFVLFVNAELEHMDCPNVFTVNQFRHHLLKRNNQLATLSEEDVAHYCERILASPYIKVSGESC